MFGSLIEHIDLLNILSDIFSRRKALTTYIPPLVMLLYCSKSSTKKFFFVLLIPLFSKEKLTQNFFFNLSFS